MKEARATAFADVDLSLFECEDCKRKPGTALLCPTCIERRAFAFQAQATGKMLADAQRNAKCYRFMIAVESLMIIGLCAWILR